MEKALTKMKEGGEVKLVIQSGYAYGAAGDEAQGVPPNAEVIYWVTLHSFIKVSNNNNIFSNFVNFPLLSLPPSPSLPRLRHHMNTMM